MLNTFLVVMLDRCFDVHCKHLNSDISCADPGIFVRGCPGQSDKKNSDVFFCFFFVVLNLFYSSQMVNFKEI